MCVVHAYKRARFMGGRRVRLATAAVMSHARARAPSRAAQRDTAARGVRSRYRARRFGARDELELKKNYFINTKYLLHFSFLRVRYAQLVNADVCNTHRNERILTRRTDRKSSERVTKLRSDDLR